MASKKTLSAVISLTDDYSSTLSKIITSTDTAEDKIRQVTAQTNVFQKSLDEMSKGAGGAGGAIGGLATKLGALVGVGYAVNKAFTMAWDAVKLADTQQVQENTLQAMLGDDKTGTMLYDYFSAYAKISMLGQEDIGKAVQSFLPTTRDLGDLEKLVNMTERLYAKDPTQGSEGAVFAMKEIMSGDTVSMRSRYNITGFDGEKIREMIAGGDSSGAIDYISGILDKFGASSAVLEKNAGSLSAQLNILGSNAQTAFAESMNGTLEALLPTIEKFTVALDSGKFQPFFDLFATGGMIIGAVLGFVADHTDELIILLGALTGLMVASAISTGAFSAAAVTAKLAQWGFNTALLASPLTWFIATLGAAIGLLSIFNSKAKSTEFKTPQQQMDETQAVLDEMMNNSSIHTTIDNDTVPVTGKVNIEEDNLKYLLDISQREYVAKFSTATLAPQVMVHVDKVEQTADLDNIVNRLGDKINQMVMVEAEG